MESCDKPMQRNSAPSFFYPLLHREVRKPHTSGKWEPCKSKWLDMEPPEDALLSPSLHGINSKFVVPAHRNAGLSAEISMHVISLISEN